MCLCMVLGVCMLVRWMFSGIVYVVLGLCSWFMNYSCCCVGDRIFGVDGVGGVLILLLV